MSCRPWITIMGISAALMSSTSLADMLWLITACNWPLIAAEQRPQELVYCFLFIIHQYH